MIGPFTLREWLMFFVGYFGVRVVDAAFGKAVLYSGWPATLVLIGIVIIIVYLAFADQP